MAVRGESGNLVVSINDFITSNKRDDAKRDANFSTPEDIERIDNLSYADDPTNVLDIYRPKNRKGKLPVIVSIHGGGWVYGDKTVNQFYCMSLAQHGFAVVNFSYRLAPKHKHPTPLIDTNKLFHWVLSHADEYGFDVDNIFAVGDSVGANIAGLFCCLCNDPEYAKRIGVEPPKGFLPKALGLNCGLYWMEREKVDVLMDNLAAEYFPEGGTDEEYAEIDLGAHLDDRFPPSFIATALGDFLATQAKPFYDRLRSLGIDAEYHCYGNEENPLKHVFHVDMNLSQAYICNADECSFFLKRISAPKEESK